MQRVDILREVEIKTSARVMQCRSLFDVPPADVSAERWSFDLDLPEDWTIGVIVGPSGSGKSTLAGELWGDHLCRGFDYPADRAVVDAFPSGMGIKDVTNVLSSVGFSSPPAWLRPFHVLSTGQKFRVDVARALSEAAGGLIVIDEFTSVVDRTVAQIGSAAVSKAVRRLPGQRFVAVTCHYDVIDWLDPDWVLEMPTGSLTRRSLQGRPPIDLDIYQADRSAWRIFAPHHYLSSDANKAARFFVAEVGGQPAALMAMLSFPHPKTPSWKIHRVVCLPDFQGVGIGSRLQDLLSEAYAATGKYVGITTTHPGLIGSLGRSKVWICTCAPAVTRPNRNKGKRGRVVKSMRRTQAVNRWSATFRYVGPTDSELARKIGLI